MNSNHKNICAVCHQGIAQCLFPIVMTRKNNDTLYTQQHNICIQCQKQLLRIKAHSEQYLLKFGKGSPKTKGMISLYMDLNQIVNDSQTDSPNKNNNHQSINSSYSGYQPQYQPFYNDSICKIINNNKLYQSQCLPNNLKYLLFCSSYDISSSERHERVKNIMLRVMVGHAFPISAIKNVSILIQVLLCYLRDFEVYIIMGKLAEVLNDDCQQSNSWGKILQGVKGDKVLDQIVGIIKQGLEQNQYRNKNKSQLKTSQFNQSHFKNKKEEINQQYVYQKKINRRLSVNCHRLEKYDYNSNLQMLKEISIMKNHCTLIMSSLLQEQQKFRQIIKQIEGKHKKQKEQYINKIIILNQKITQLEKKQSILIPRQQIYKINNSQEQKQISIQQILSLANNHSKHSLETKQSIKRSINTEKKVGKQQAINNKRQKSKLYLNINNQQQQQNQIDQNSITQKKKQKKQFIENQKYSIFETNIMKIINQTNIIPIPQSVQNICSKVIDSIILNINMLEQQNKTLNLKIKQHQSQVRRLLLILKKKQQKLIPLMHEKDQIIQMYQNALWKLQNGLPMGDNKLAPRIEMIRNLQMESQLLKKQQKIQKNVKKKKESIKDKTNEGKVGKRVQNIQKNQREKQSCIIF